ncbi:MAG: SPOR domain-containing protein [Gammaproteobacteria bacterium]|nr:SPOR domain-containing protein [Gammaproteobacteria bacterium]MBU2058871.1 SPOR domain-containing protein [Gammaproteobacteria bacterium]MBU2177066.1 SPOR domain-containing protein [Gammaproteobacteria bacterium]MBU2247052.1 SPOR domain-containing protein [Gammaproteobacteria bacterium]MBU2345330.1 SPOR domain-containing protein [Gammaproteobacteria bacterium]
MTSAFKNRLIGSSILIIAAIVFLPDLLDGQKQVVKDEFKAIPERPEFATVQQEQVFTKQQLAEKQQELLATPVNEPATDAGLPDNSFAQVTAGAAGSEAVTDSAAMVAEPSEGATTDPIPVPTENPLAPVTSSAASPVAEQPAEPKGNPALNETAWIVRVGSFGKTENATALVAKLKEAGFTTFTRSTTNAQGQSMVSVVVGPELKKERLEQKLPQLQELTGTQGLKLTAFKPIENN